MNGKALAFLVLVALAVGGGAYVAFSRHAVLDQPAQGQLAFPKLAEQAAGAERVVLRQVKKTLTLVHGDTSWGIAEKDGYPALPDKVHALFSGLADMRLRETRTAQPSEYTRLGVEDPTQDGATGALIQVLGKSAPIAELIVGHRRAAQGTSTEQQMYVRRPNEAQSWLADGSVDADTDFAGWVGHDLTNISRERVKSVSSTGPDGSFAFSIADGKASLDAPADHPELDPSKLDDVARGLEYLTLSDVAAAAKQPGTLLADTVFTTKDGLAVKLHVTLADKALWVSFSATGDGEAAKEATTIDQGAAGWAFQVGDWKRTGLAPTLKDLLPKEPEKTPNSASQQ